MEQFFSNCTDFCGILYLSSFRKPGDKTKCHCNLKRISDTVYVLAGHGTDGDVVHAHCMLDI